MQPQPEHLHAVPSQRAEDDAARAHHGALQHGDEVVQQLAVAKYALSVGDIPRAMDAIDAALGTSRRILSALLDRVQPPHATSYAGTLVRSVPAQPERDSQAPRTPQP